MTNVFAAEQVCSSYVLKDISPTGEFSYENLTGGTPEAVMAQLKPFYKKYKELTHSNPDPYSDVYGFSYSFLSASYTFIGFNSTRDNITYYDVNSQSKECTHLEIINLKPPQPPFENCFAYEGTYPSIQCKPPTCPAPTNGQRAAADCTQTVSLTPATGQTEPRPKGSEGDGKSTYDLIAKVTEGNQPKAGMALTFTAEVEAGSGNHPTSPANRPPGILSVKSGTTNASGEVKVTFTSPIFAGIHKVKVTCTKCTGTVKEAESKFNVKVPNLIKTPAYKNWHFISTDNYHKNNNASAATQTVYYLTQAAQTNLKQLTDYMVGQGWKNTAGLKSVGLNDASLEWGGKFYSYPGSGSIYPDWTGIKSNGKQYAHVEHRVGTQIDLRTNDVNTQELYLEEIMYKKLCPQDGKYPVQAKILWHTGKAKNAAGKSIVTQHYHAYLLGDIDSKLGGGKCRITHT